MLRQKKLHIAFFFVVIFLAVLMCNNGYAAVGGEDYDPQHTMLALNTAIVSIHRILTTEDRIILDQEYKNIINNLKFGNIEDDYALKDLYEELLNVISKKTLRKEELARFQRKYDSREKNLLVNSLTNIRAYGGNAWSFLGSLVTSGVSAYFGYQNSKNELLEELDDELWALHNDDIEDINDLQKRLLDSSWSLLRQYKLPDEYRLTQANMTDFDKAVQETDSDKSVRMFRALEPHFKVYPPFWYFYGKAAFQNGDIELARKCFTEFENVWRPVLRHDPYRLEVAKYRVMDLSDNKASNEEIIAQLNIIRENAFLNDWNSNLFAGVMYFSVGDKEQGMDRLRININFGSEREISGQILQSMQEGKLDYNLLSSELRSILEVSIQSSEEQAQRDYATSLNKQAEQYYQEGKVKEAEELFLRAANQGSTDAQYSLAKMFLSGDIIQDDRKAVEWLTKSAESENRGAQYTLARMYMDGQGVPKDAEKALHWLQKAANSGYAKAQNALGYMYQNGYGGIKSDYAQAATLYRKAAEQGDPFAQHNLALAYERGHGVGKNLEEAYMWYYIASQKSFSNSPEDQELKLVLQMKLDTIEKKGWTNTIKFWQGLSKDAIERVRTKAREKMKTIK
ncbi:MAG: sel1 repeat family protein [Holosporales bacterium]|jgi:TPR repeat protein|nr:sel1 repeat family protein [Holosporales bacterium]